MGKRARRSFRCQLLQHDFLVSCRYVLADAIQVLCTQVLGDQPCTHDLVLILYKSLSGKSCLQQFPVGVAIMKFATHMLILAAWLATAVAAPASGVPKGPFVVTLALSSNMKSIQANVTNTGAEVRLSGIIGFTFVQLRSLLVTRCNHPPYASFYGRSGRLSGI